MSGSDSAANEWSSYVKNAYATRSLNMHKSQYLQANQHIHY